MSAGPLSRALAGLGVTPPAGGSGWSLPPAGEPAGAMAARVLTGAGYTLGRALAGLCDCLNPEAVILGGEIGATGAAFVAGVRAALDQCAQPATAAAVRVRAAGLGTRAELMGAVALAAACATGQDGPIRPHSSLRGTSGSASRAVSTGRRDRISA